MKNSLLLFILGVSVFLNLYGIRWGLPVHWYPDEYETIEMTVIPMARNLDPNPHYFLKPSFYYYLLSMIMLPYFIVIKTFGIQIESYQDFIGTVTLIARVATALIGVLGVYFMYLIGKTIRDKNAGLISAGLLTITLGYASYAHLAYYDIPMITMMLVALYFCFKYLNSSKISYLYWGSFIGGLAFSTKYNALFFIGLVLVICAIHKVVSETKENPTLKNVFGSFFSKSMFFILGLFVLGFIIGTPFSILDFQSFVRDIVEQFFTTKDIKGYHGSKVWLTNIVHFKTILGLPLSMLLAGTFLYGIYRWVKNPGFQRAVLVFVPLITLIYMSTWRISAIRYVLPVIPFFIFSAGIFLSETVENRGKLKIITLALFGMICMYTAHYAWRGIRSFSNDTREIASQWIEENIASGDQVEVYAYFSYLPRFPKDVVVNQYNPNYIPLSFSYETFKKSALGQKLVDQKADSVITESNRYAFSMYSLNDRHPDYIVLSSFYYKRYVSENDQEAKRLFPELCDYFNRLINGDAGYQTIEIFNNAGTNMEGYFLNPEIIILKKI